MKALQRLGSAVVLTFVLSLSAFVGKAQTNGCDPGQMSTPPCSAAQPSEGWTTGEISTPPASSTETTVLVTEVVLELLDSVLPLF